ncbi:MAG: type II toxin-antitoxin system RelE/ParE family toxin [Streptomyces sp.]|nr:type II toxin-antitoxin system RelE/ParE family toxin [Streptomyces sp.]
MAYEITWEPAATSTAVRYLKEDPAGLSAVYEAVDALASEPRPPGSLPYGSPSLRRLYVGDYRVLYIIDADVIHIMVTHLGRTA